MKKPVLQNPAVSLALIYGGLALMMWPSMLRKLDVVNYGKSTASIFLIIGVIIEVIGLALNLYQQKQMGNEAYLERYVYNIGIGVTIVLAMMTTSTIFIHHPS